jgi:glycosyltransferase involved in cell wall biosynthesis
MREALEQQRIALLDDFKPLTPLAAELAGAVRGIETDPNRASVVITCKNKALVLPVVLERIARQTRRADLVVLADDASTDASVEIFEAKCREFGLAHVVAALPPGDNYRLNTIRNLGFEAALDGLVMLIDGDVVLSPIYIERHLQQHVRHRNIVSMGPRFEYGTENRAGPVNFMWGYGAEQQGLDADGYLPAWQRAHGGLCVSRAIWKAIGGFDEGYNGTYGIDDLDFLFRLFLAEVFPICDFEAYCIHIPHDTLFAGGRDSRGNIAYFCKKYDVAETVLADPIDFSPLAHRRSNWAKDYSEFLRGLKARKASRPRATNPTRHAGLATRFLSWAHGRWQ